MKKAILLTLLIVVNHCSMAGLAQAQYAVDDVICSEFFDDVLRIEPGSVTDLFDIAQTDNITNIAIADSGTAYVNNFLEIWRLTAGNTVTLLATLEGNAPAEITMDLNGDLLVCSASHGIQRIDTVTGDISLVYDQTFFNVDDIAVSAEGFIYATEFFDGLGRVNPNGTWTKLGDWPTDFFNHVDIGPDGYLYLSTTNEEGDIYRVNPTSGAGEKIADNVFDFIDDLQVAGDGTIYVAGNRDTDNDGLTEDMVLTLSPGSWTLTVVVDENMVGDPSPPFFNPMDIEIFDNVFHESAPGILPPDSMFVSRGQLHSGTVDLLADSDNVDVSVRRSPSDIQSRTELITTGISYALEPTVLELTVEASVFARSNVTQYLWMYNFDGGGYELVDARSARRFVDQSVTIQPGGDLSRFVDDTTGEVMAIIEFQGDSPRLNFSSNIDRVVWSIR